MHLRDIYFMGMHLMGRVPHGRVPHGRVPHLRVFLARRTRVARFLISTPRMVEKLLIVGDSAVRLLVTLGARSAW
jgi:hypothetical protein